MDNIITAVFGAARDVKTRPVWRIDRGMKLRITGLDLPEYYQVHFANQPVQGEAIPVLVSGDTVDIPDQYFQPGQDIYAWIYLTPSDGVGYTIRRVTIPVKARPDISGDEPTPVQESIIDQAIAALNENVGIAETSAQTAQEAADRAETAASGVESVTERAEAAAEAAEQAAEGIDEYTSRAETAAQTAQSAAQSASVSASAASTSEGKASDYAAQALSSASVATQKGAAAAESASAAATSASSASTDATSARRYAQDANTSKNRAAASQTAAETAKTSAETAAETAATSASQAAQSATDAAGSASAAAQTLTQVQAEGAAQIAAIDAEGREVLDSIPADYTALEGEVTELKSQMSEKAPAIMGNTTPVQSTNIVTNEQEITVYGNGFAHDTVKIANREQFAINSFPSGTTAGVMRQTTDDGLLNLNGALTENRAQISIMTSAAAVKIPSEYKGSRVNLRIVSDKECTIYTYNSYTPAVQIYLIKDGETGGGRYAKDIFIGGVDHSFVDGTVNLGFASDDDKIYCLFRYFGKDSTFDNVNFRLYCYPETANVFDTTITVSDGETKAFNVPDGYTVVDTGVHQNALYGVVDTKEYVDSHIPSNVVTTETLAEYVPNEKNLVYVTPEMFGAVGDGSTDDYTALQGCIDAAIQSGVAIRGYGKYLSTQPVTVIGDSQNVYIHNLIYTGSDVGFVLSGNYNCVRIDRLYAYNSTGAGFRLTTNADKDASYNKINLGAVYAHANGIEYVNDFGLAENRRVMYYNVLHVQRLYSKTSNGIYFHSTGGQGNENSFWGKHVSCNSGWLLYCDADNANPLYLYEFCFETSCEKGVFGSAKLINCRTAECMDKKRPDNGDVGTIFKLAKIYYAEWIGTTNVDYDCLDVSGCDTYQDRYDYANQLYQQGNLIAYSLDMAFKHLRRNVLGRCIRLWDFYTRNSNGQCPPGKLIVYFNHKGFVPDNPWYHKISVADYTPLVTDKWVPTDFDIDVAQCTIHLNDSYCCVGIKEFTLTQYEDKKAIVYEKNDAITPIFDGTNLSAGTYRFKCVMLPKEINLLKADGTVGYTSVYSNIYFGDNERWTVERLNIVS